MPWTKRWILLCALQVLPIMVLEGIGAYGLLKVVMMPYGLIQMFGWIIGGSHLGSYVGYLIGVGVYSAFGAWIWCAMKVSSQ